MKQLPAEDMAQWTAFYRLCSEIEASAAQMGLLHPVDVKMFRVFISSEAAAQTADMFVGKVPPSTPIVGPLPERPASPPPAPHGSGSIDLEQYHAQCTTKNILTCVPTCNSSTHGYELLATIDGTDTKFSCTVSSLLYSWVGAAALGGFLGQNVAAFVSAVISGAAGSYVLTLMEDAGVSTDLTIEPGQNLIISGNMELVDMFSGASWGEGGMKVMENGILSLAGVTLAGPLTVAASGLTKLSSVDFVGSAVSISMAEGGTVNAEGVKINGQVLLCDPLAGSACSVEGGRLKLVGPLIVSADGSMINAANLVYGGSNMQAFFSAVVSGESGFYMATVSSNANVGTDLTIQPGQSVRIRGDQDLERAPSWGAGSFLVLERGSLSLSSLMVSGLISARPGGIIDLTEVALTSSLPSQIDLSAGATISTNRLAGDFGTITQTYTVGNDGHTITKATPGAIDKQCFENYEIVSDAWRNVQTPGASNTDGTWHTDSACLGSSGCSVAGRAKFVPSGIGGDRWYRFTLPAGDAIPTSPTQTYAHCGTYNGGWLSGAEPNIENPDTPLIHGVTWRDLDPQGRPPDPSSDWTPAMAATATSPFSGFSRPGHYPDVEEGAAERIVCFSVDADDPLGCYKPRSWSSGVHCARRCYSAQYIKVVNCGSHLLWRLPFAEDNNSAFCAADAGVDSSAAGR
jgi:hypothetical protein